MGSTPSKPPPPDVDLLPPKFDRRINPLERLPLSPFEYMFGAEARDRLFTNHFAQRDTLQFAGSFRPDYEEKAKVAVAIDVAKNAAGASSFQSGGFTNNAYVALGYNNEDPDVMVAARLGTDGSARVVAAGLDPDRGVGGYASVPLDYLIDGAAARRHSQQAVADVRERYRAAGVGFGLGGAPVRYTHTVISPALVGGAVAEVASPSAVTSSGASTSSVTEPHTGRGVGSAPALPEVGVRYLGPDNRYAVGMHAAPVEPFPFKAWAVGAVGGDVNVGLEVSSDVFRALPRAQSFLSAAPARADAANVKAGAGGAAAALGASSSAQPRFDVGAAVSVSQAPLYELSLAFDGARKEVVAGFVYNQVLRRKVYNVLEDRRVKGIYNYVDLGLELRRPLMMDARNPTAAAPASLALAAAWQLNRNVMFKGRVGTNDASASVVFKSWWDTAVTACATVTLDRRTFGTSAGFFLSAERGGALDYQKATEGYQTRATSMAVLAAPQLSERVSRRVDTQPFAPPPPGVTAAGAAVAASGRQPLYAGELDAVRGAVRHERSRFL